MTPKMITSTALSLVMAMGATTVTAQDTSSDSDTSDQTMMEKIEAADAPHTAETDPVNETASSGTKMAQSNGSTSGGAILDLQSLSHDIYERGYRQGYIRGVQEARQDFVMQLRYMAKRGQLMESYQDWEINQLDGSNSDNAQNNAGESTNQQAQSDGSSVAPMLSDGSAASGQQSANAANSGASGSDFDINERSNMMRARPGGTIVILPAGISPERFIENLVDSRREAIGGNSDN